MAGVLRSTTTRGTAQHNRGIKRKRSITQIPAPAPSIFAPFAVRTSDMLLAFRVAFDVAFAGL
jgi:hypothetical protein